MIQFYAIFKVKTYIHNVDKEYRVPITQSLYAMLYLEFHELAHL